VVNRLLQDPRVDLSAVNNYDIHAVALSGHLDVVDRLLDDARVDPAAQDNAAILEASRNGPIDVVSCLLADDRVFLRVTSCSMFCDAFRVVFLEQLAKHHCKQFNINSDGAFYAGFAGRIR
jgi:hypothetical protein